MPVITAEKLIEITTAYRYEKNISQLARDCGVSRSSVIKYTKKEATRVHVKRPIPRRVTERRALVRSYAEAVTHTGRGRSHKTHHSSDKIRRVLLREHRISVNIRTINRDLHAVGKRSRVRRTVCSRERKDLVRRAAFRLSVENLNPRSIIFSDETWLSTKERTGLREWVGEGETAFTREDKSRRNLDSFQAWAAAGYNFKSPLIMFPKQRDRNGELKAFTLDGPGYVRRCLGKIGKSLEVRKQEMADLGYGELQFQQDHARCHDSVRALNWFQTKKLMILQGYPAYSPDYNMIELVWKDLHAAIGEIGPETEDELRAAAVKAWDEMPQSKINAHVLHFTNAVQNV